MTESKRLPQIEKFLDKRKTLLEEETELRSLESFQQIPEEFLPIIEQLEELTQTWNPVELVTPSKESLQREKDHFFTAFEQEEVYNPQFDYSHAESIEFDSEQAVKVLERALKNIRSFSPKNRTEKIFKVALYYKIRDDLATAQLVQGIREKDDAQIKKALTKKYAQTDEGLIEIATQEYQKNISPRTELGQNENEQPLLSPEQIRLLESVEITAEDTKEAFDWVMREYGFSKENEQDGFSTKITDEVLYIDVRDKSEEPMTVFIPEKRTDVMTGIKLLELIYHEIEGHVRQSMNGKKIMIGGGKLRIDEEVLYEGLAKRLDAKFHREYLGENTGVPKPYYTFAVQMAEQGASFSEIFKDQLNRNLHDILKIAHDQPLPPAEEITADKLGKAKELAWKYTYRVMRGHIDTSNKEGFAFAKDLAYLRGYLLDKQLVEEGLGHINELAIMQIGALQLVAEIDFSPEDLPFPFKDLTKRYCFEVLLPKLEASQQV